MTCQWREKIGVSEFEGVDSVLPCHVSGLNINGADIDYFLRPKALTDTILYAGYDTANYYHCESDESGYNTVCTFNNVLVLRFNGFAEAGIIPYNVSARAIGNTTGDSIEIIEFSVISPFEYVISSRETIRFAYGPDDRDANGGHLIEIMFSMLDYTDKKIFFYLPTGA